MASAHFLAGDHRITHDVRFDDVQFDRGARLVVDGGATVRVRGQVLAAPDVEIFAGEDERSMRPTELSTYLRDARSCTIKAPRVSRSIMCIWPPTSEGRTSSSRSAKGEVIMRHLHISASGRTAKGKTSVPESRSMRSIFTYQMIQSGVEERRFKSRTSTTEHTTALAMLPLTEEETPFDPTSIPLGVWKYQMQKFIRRMASEPATRSPGTQTRVQRYSIPSSSSADMRS
jgi:hypothetical protein